MIFDIDIIAGYILISIVSEKYCYSSICLINEDGFELSSTKFPQIDVDYTIDNEVKIIGVDLI